MTQFCIIRKNEIKIDSQEAVLLIYPQPYIYQTSFLIGTLQEIQSGIKHLNSKSDRRKYCNKESRLHSSNPKHAVLERVEVAARIGKNRPDSDPKPIESFDFKHTTEAIYYSHTIGSRFRKSAPFCRSPIHKSNIEISRFPNAVPKLTCTALFCNTLKVISVCVDCIIVV